MAAEAFNPGVIDTHMLRQCWGDEAGAYERPDRRAERSGDFLLQLSTKDSGRSVEMK